MPTCLRNKVSFLGMRPILSVQFFSQFLSILLISLITGLANAQSKSELPLFDEPAVPVMIWNREITQIRAPFGDQSPSQRAAGIEDKILAIPSDHTGYKVEAQNATLGTYNGAWIMVNNRIIFGLLNQDANLVNGESFESFTKKTVENLQAWLQIRAEQQKWPLVLKSLSFAIAATIAFGFTLFFSLRFNSRWLAKRNQLASDPTSLPLLQGNRA